MTPGRLLRIERWPGTQQDQVSPTPPETSTLGIYARALCSVFPWRSALQGVRRLLRQGSTRLASLVDSDRPTITTGNEGLRIWRGV